MTGILNDDFYNEKRRFQKKKKKKKLLLIPELIDLFSKHFQNVCQFSELELLYEVSSNDK